MCEVTEHKSKIHGIEYATDEDKKGILITDKTLGKVFIPLEHARLFRAEIRGIDDRLRGIIK